MESAKIYKLTIEMNSDKSYHIKQQNLFLDAHAEKAQIHSSDGNLSDEEFNQLTGLIANSRIFHLNDTYGFKIKNVPTENPLNGTIYHLNYTEGKKEKYILIQPNPLDTYPKNAALLIQFLNNFASNHIPK